MRRVLFALTVFLTPLTTGVAQQYDFSGKVGLGFTIGRWQPQNLQSETTIPIFSNVPNARPYLGIFLSSHWRGSLALRNSIGIWTQKRLEELADVKSVTIIPVGIGLKHQLVLANRLSPFVSYEFGVYFGIENSGSTPTYRQTHIGYGFEGGAGFDFFLTERWGTALEFQYQYVRFGQRVGSTDDYSGPKASLRLYYLLGGK